jgi:hypothetical protein
LLRHELFHLAATALMFILPILLIVMNTSPCPLDFTKVVNDVLKYDGYPLPAYADGELLLLVVLTIFLLMKLLHCHPI